MEEESIQVEQQNLLRSLRFIEEISYLLRLSRPCTKTAMDYFHLLSSSQTHQFQIQIMIAASIFLSAKVFQTELKIRDILNMVFTDTVLHRLIKNERVKAEQQGKVFILGQMFQKEGLLHELQPSYSINSYNELKPKVLEAEQHLLRILGFDFGQSQKNSTEFKTILVLIHQLRLPQIMGQTILNTYNDLPFTGVEKWIAGIIYFGYLVGKAVLKEKPHENVQISNQQWETIFCTKIEKLRNYSNKLTNFYENRHNERLRESQPLLSFEDKFSK